MMQQESRAGTASQDHSLTLQRKGQSGIREAPLAPPLQHGHTSASRVHRLHSSWHAVMGWMACAFRISSGLASEMPRYLTLPSWTKFCM